MPAKRRNFKIIDGRIKDKWYQDDSYLNGYAKVCGWKATLVYISLCRHADRNQESFPSYELMAKEHGVSESTIKRGIYSLIEYNIIEKGQKRSKKGNFLHNTYTLLDKSEWKKPVRRSPETHGHRRSPQTGTVGLLRPHKDTHIKDTHTSLGVPNEGKKTSFGNPDINKILEEIKTCLSLPVLDGSVRVNRRYAYNLLRKFKGVDGVLRLIRLAGEDEWYKDNITSAKDLYYNAMKIITRKRGGNYNAERTRAIDASQFTN